MTSASPPTPSVGWPPAFSAIVPAIIVTTVTRNTSTTPAAAEAMTLADRSRTRSGEARIVLVMVRWRHSPVIPMAPSRTIT